MKTVIGIARTVSLLVLLSLGIGILSSEGGSEGEASTSCPQRDQCLDQAYAIYLSDLARADSDYQNCTQAVSDNLNLCLDGVSQELGSCVYRAESDYGTGIARCEQILNQTQYEQCIGENYALYQQSLTSCYSTYEASNDQCWGQYYALGQICTNQHVQAGSAAQEEYIENLNYCNTLCN
jgi:hypothetical protein